MQGQPSWADDTETPPHGIPAQRAMAPPAGPDRVWVHLIWEAVLLLGVLLSALTVIAVGDSDSLTSEAGLRTIAQRMAVLGLLATGLALSLRVAAPNLAVGAIAASTGAGFVWLATEQDWPLGGAILMMLLAAAAVGLALAMIVVGLHVPAWAASLGAAAVLTVIPAVLLGNRGFVLSEPVPSAIEQPWLWLAVFVVISVGGGALWAMPGVRARFAGTRANADPARRTGGNAAIGATLGLVGSSVLAAGSGILLVLNLRGFVPGTPADATAALAAVLLGGVSVFGRRAGIFGTVLAVAVLALLQHALVVGGAKSWSHQLLFGGAILLGLVVSRTLELAGRRDRVAA